MPKVNKDPIGLRPYLFHGVNLYMNRIEGEECPGECPSCGREDRFSVNINTSQAQCLHGKCGFSCNASSFMAWLWEHSDATLDQYTELAQERRLLYTETLMHWGVVRSATMPDKWIVPGYSIKPSLCQLYIWARMGKRSRLLATPTLTHQLHRPTTAGGFNPSKSEIYLCEGPWDAMILWELLGNAKWNEEGEQLRSSANRENNSLLTDANVMAVPGCLTFSEAWAPLFAEKVVYLLYDSDHPIKSKSGKLLPPAGQTGMRRVATILAGAVNPPEQIVYLRWGSKGYNKDLPSGFDLRDGLAITKRLLSSG